MSLSLVVCRIARSSTLSSQELSPCHQPSDYLPWTCIGYPPVLSPACYLTNDTTCPQLAEAAAMGEGTLTAQKVPLRATPLKSVFLGHGGVGGVAEALRIPCYAVLLAHQVPWEPEEEEEVEAEDPTQEEVGRA